uniref:DUF19 domain-containing protein n=1 Tax=Caenorhabditis japonica TaxID=281687 RepID=A0A8R1HK95_CAEJA
MANLFRSSSILAVISAIFVGLASGQNNRAKACQKAINLGLTFYTAKELEPILVCSEVPFYNNPDDVDGILSNFKKCVISNSKNKALVGLSLYNGFNGCTDLMALVDKGVPPVYNQCKPIIKKATNVLNKCKANNQKTGTAKLNACMNNVYGQILPMVTKQFVNKVCTALAKKVTPKEWGCCKKYGPKVMKTELYSCFNL